MSKKTGTREWAEETVNIQKGCEHNCRYCYARANALRFKQIAESAEWATPKINSNLVNKGYRKRKGVLMFPSTHDITPANFIESLCVISKLLDSGNQVLIVSKPNYTCIEQMCDRLSGYKEQLEFRFTIGSTNDKVLGFWEPKAPRFAERMNCLKLAHFKNYRTSVSAEPYLDKNIFGLYRMCFPYITESFWIGMLRQFNKRVVRASITVEQQYDFVRPLLECQSANAVRRIYSFLDGKPLIRWKDSIREIIDNNAAIDTRGHLGRSGGTITCGSKNELFR